MSTIRPSNTDLAPGIRDLGSGNAGSARAASISPIFVIPYVVCESRPHAAMVSGAVQNILWLAAALTVTVDWRSAVVAPA